MEHCGNYEMTRLGRWVGKNVRLVFSRRMEAASKKPRHPHSMSDPRSAPFDSRHSRGRFFSWAHAGHLLLSLPCRAQDSCDWDILHKIQGLQSQGSAAEVLH